MNKTIFVKPVAGYVVRGRNNVILPEQGANVPDDSFWRRRIQDGAVVIVENQPKKATTKKAAAPKKAEGVENGD